MKKTITLLSLMLLSSIVKGQIGIKYLIIDQEFNPNLSYSRVESAYLGEKFEIINLRPTMQPSKGNLIYESFEYRKPLIVLGIFSYHQNEKLRWKKVSLDTIGKQVIRLSDVIQHCQSFIKKNYLYKDDWGINIQPILKIKNSFYTLSNGKCIFDYFETIPLFKELNTAGFYFEEVFKQTVSPYFILNMNNKIMRIKDVESGYKNLFDTFSYNVQGEERLMYSVNQSTMIKDIDTLWNQQVVSRFWLFSNWVVDGESAHRAIDRLSYHTEYGVIAGVYTSHFLFKSYVGKFSQLSYDEVLKLRATLLEHYLHDIQSTPLRIEVNGKVVYEKKE